LKRTDESFYIQSILTMQTVSIQGTVRAQVGKSDTKVVRAKEEIPCVLYGQKEIIHFTTNWNEVRHLIYTPDFKTAELTINGQSYSAILKDVQFHPSTEKILHIDFLKLTPGRSINVSVPLRLQGSSPGVKSGGRLIQSVRKIKVKCVPEKLVDEVVLDISNLDLGQTVRVRDIQAQSGIEITMTAAIPVASIEIPRAMRQAATAEAKAAPGKKK
jgi:large subunit ribosomal protein L25